MIIKSENNITLTDIKALINCNSSRLKFMLILLTVTFGGFLIFSFAFGSAGKNSGYCIAGILWCAFVFLYVFVLQPGVKYRKFRKKYSDNASIKYEFSEKSVKITIESEKNNLEKYKKYSEMFRIYETSEYYFFCTKRAESYIMKKSNLTDEEVVKLSEFIINENPNAFTRKVN